MSKHIDPNTEQFAQFKNLPRDEPIMMLNLIRLRDSANYPDDTVITGAEAYARYGQETATIFAGVGGEIIFRGAPQGLLIGPIDEHWDIVFIARYPNAGAFLAMVTNPDYQVAVVHRQSAVDDSRLIRLGETSAGQGF